MVNLNAALGKEITHVRNVRYCHCQNQLNLTDTENLPSPSLISGTRDC